MPSLQVFSLALLLTCVDAAPLIAGHSEAALQARASTSKKKPKKTMTKKQGIIFGSVFGGFFVLALLCSFYQNIKNWRRAQRKKKANQQELKKAVEFDKNGKPFFKRKARPKKTPSMPDLGSSATATSHGDKLVGGAVDDSGVPSLAHATIVKKPEPVVARRENDAWKEGTTVVAGPDAKDQEVPGVADLSLEKVKGGEGVEKAPFRLF